MMDRGTPLTAADYSALADRWIDPETADAAGLRRVDDREGSLIVGKNGSGNYSGIAIPYCLPGTLDVRGYRLRVDHPPINADGKPAQKYLAEPGSSNKLFFPPRIDCSWLEAAGISICLTEGEYKTLALDRLSRHELGDTAEHPRFLALGISGIWNWRGVTGKGNDASGARVDVKGPIADLGLINWQSRIVIIVFDADLETNPKVRQAREALTGELRSRGAKVRWAQWPRKLPAGVKGIDDFCFHAGPEAALEMIQNARPEKLTVEHQQKASRQFTALREDFYRLEIPDLGVTFEIDRLRREHQELIGELCVRCDLPGARSYDGNLSIADFNLSSARARTERAKLLADRSKNDNLDWLQMLEEFCQRVLTAEREGKPGVDLRTFETPPPNDDIEIAGFRFPRRHPTIIFGDGGTSKSYLSLYLGGLLAQQGMRIALFDWELDGPDHKLRLQHLFGNDMPYIVYLRCDRPLIFEVDRLRRAVQDHGIQYAYFDSVALAVQGAPESSEAAIGYLRAVRQVCSASTHIAHMTKGEGGDQKPFGSVFWWNGARAIWYAQKSEDSTETVLQLGLFSRKANLGARPSCPIGYTVTFGETATTFKRSDPSNVPEFAAKLSVRQRMYAMLKKGAHTTEAIAEELQVEPTTIRSTVSRHGKLFIRLPDGRIGLAS